MGYMGGPKESQKRWRRKHPEVWQKSQKLWRLTHLDWRRNYLEKNREHFNLYRRQWRLKAREEVLRHYSGDIPFCQCCGEKYIEFLGIDHINGGGNDFRKKNRGGNLIYGWLKKNNYPLGFRVLCHNCNMSIGFYGYCPHQKHEDVKVGGPGNQIEVDERRQRE